MSISIDTILSEFDDQSQAWTLQDNVSGRYVTIPHKNYPGRNIIHLFLSREDAEKILMEICNANPNMRSKSIFPVRVNLKQAIRGIASDKNPQNANGFVVHSPNEVYEYLRERTS